MIDNRLSSSMADRGALFAASPGGGGESPQKASPLCVVESLSPVGGGEGRQWTLEPSYAHSPDGCYGAAGTPSWTVLEFTRVGSSGGTKEARYEPGRPWPSYTLTTVEVHRGWEAGGPAGKGRPTLLGYAEDGVSLSSQRQQGAWAGDTWSRSSEAGCMHWAEEATARSSVLASPVGGGESLSPVGGGEGWQWTSEPLYAYSPDGRYGAAGTPSWISLEFTRVGSSGGTKEARY